MQSIALQRVAPSHQENGSLELQRIDSLEIEYWTRP